MPSSSQTKLLACSLFLWDVHGTFYHFCFGPQKNALYVMYMKCGIQWDCCSFCVKALARKRLVEIVVDLGH
jgi:hypothetical protein